MASDLLVQALRQAEKADSTFQIEAKLRISRVLRVENPDQAKELFTSALHQIESLPEDAASLLWKQAGIIAVEAAPELLLSISARAGGDLASWGDQILGRLLSRKNLPLARDFVLHYSHPASFPFATLGSLLRALKDRNQRRELLRKAIPLGKQSLDDSYLRVLGEFWQALPETEMMTVVEELVERIENAQDSAIQSSFYDEVFFTSLREHKLFLILHLLLYVDPFRAEQLLGAYRELAQAARRYPNGLEAVREENDPASTAENGFDKKGKFRISNSSELEARCFRLLYESDLTDESLQTLLQIAAEEYQQDTNTDDPNLAPKEYWFSTFRYSQIFYRAGSLLGDKASVYLDAIADADLRLIAQTEFLAGRLGLAELPSLRMRRKKSVEGKAEE